MRRGLTLLVPAMALAACSGEPAEPAPEAVPETAAAANVPSFGVAGVLTEEDIAGAELGGELGCSFTEAGADGPALVAMGWVGANRSSQGVLKLDGETVGVRSREASGFGGMIEGAEFLGGDLVVNVMQISEEDTDPGEASTYPAELEIMRASNGEMSVAAGEWTCGP
ncbi:hypothetical protein FHS61_000536 [Altererythrobacter atlanticus]|uniref:Uncharacterized protein n=1 Tax=Croceibacterium atlanticum TaxID=1267766 RepID=A0A0F7KU12_9SPHN|nr:hypothetical protein [Croceibacterium atlanticum]AKH42762.1 hypothetical protein WYH_01726 [Croceibacterium atlanticum]MBB5731543.1 hypothetical protein [Croceibacterium atlanticum]